MDKIFNNKRTYTAYDGEEYLNLSIPVVDTSKMTSNTCIRLSKDHYGRIDKFTCNTVEKSLDSIDDVMYYNHIFNPFAIKEGDMLFVPTSNSEIITETNEPIFPDGKKYSQIVSGEKQMSYAATVEYLGLLGLGIK